MIKKLLLTLVLVLLSSCTLHSTYESNIHNILEGYWKVNDTDTTVTFTNDGYSAFNDTLIGSYEKMPAFKQGPCWVWNEKSPEDYITWTIGERTGKLIFIHYLNDCQTLDIYWIENGDTTRLQLHSIYPN